MTERSAPELLRCAVYTRKSTEEGLEQDFNSLDAQREACEAYIMSQRHEGWRLERTGYDDGGYSGGSMERPGLKRLLQDVRSGRIDAVVVYKVDRLTRSLADFAKIVEVFDTHGVSFVSVTQAFNTTTSMGRLTLNVLLSFAQFEREVTGERIRDKIAASKKKGMWMGGFVPLGYRAVDRSLVIHQSEAAIVRKVFELYLKHGTVQRVEAELARKQILRPVSTVRNGRSYGGRSFRRGEIYKLLASPLYAGEVGHRGQRYSGQHRGIVDPKVWRAVQDRLASNGHRHRMRLGAKETSLLAGLLFDEQGNRLTPTHASRRGRRYRYYALHSAHKPRGGVDSRPSGRSWRVPAAEIESIVTERLRASLSDARWVHQHCCKPDDSIERRQEIAAAASELAEQIHSSPSTVVRDQLLRYVSRITIADRSVRIELCREQLERIDAEGRNSGPGRVHESTTRKSQLTKYATGSRSGALMLTIRISVRRRGVETKLIMVGGQQDPGRKPDAALIKAVVRARMWFQELVSGETTIAELAARESMTGSSLGRVLPLAFLAPDILDTIIGEGEVQTFTAQDLIRKLEIPLLWREQRAWVRADRSGST